MLLCSDELYVVQSRASCLGVLGNAHAESSILGPWALALPSRGNSHTVADQMTHEDSRTILRRIANDYDRLAKLAEEQRAAQEKQKD
jgi:hypothetical protein